MEWQLPEKQSQQSVTAGKPLYSQPLGEIEMKGKLLFINVLFGVVAGVAIGYFFDIGGNKLYVCAGEIITGVTAGAWLTKKMKETQILQNMTMGSILFCNGSMWFGIAAGLLAGAMTMYLLFFIVFIPLFGHPESRAWPDAVNLTFETMLFFSSGIAAILIGIMLSRNSLKFIEVNNGHLTRPLDADRG